MSKNNLNKEENQKMYMTWFQNLDKAVMVTVEQGSPRAGQASPQRAEGLGGTLTSVVAWILTESPHFSGNVTGQQ